MGFRNDVRDAILGVVKNHLRLSENDVYFASFAGDVEERRWSREFLATLLREGLFSKEEMRDAVEYGIVQYGLAMYEQVRGGQYPDHVRSPAALAYTIRMGRIPYSQAVKINFDHGETLEQFMKRGDGLVDTVLTWLSEGPRPETSSEQLSLAVDSSESHN